VPNSRRSRRNRGHSPVLALLPEQVNAKQVNAKQVNVPCFAYFQETHES
jgi:hypothetical protein